MCQVALNSTLRLRGGTSYGFYLLCLGHTAWSRTRPYRYTQHKCFETPIFVLRLQKVCPPIALVPPLPMTWRRLKIQDSWLSYGVVSFGFANYHLTLTLWTTVSSILRSFRVKPGGQWATEQAHASVPWFSSPATSASSLCLWVRTWNRQPFSGILQTACGILDTRLGRGAPFGSRCRGGRAPSPSCPATAADSRLKSTARSVESWAGCWGLFKRSVWLPGSSRRSGEKLCSCPDYLATRWFWCLLGRVRSWAGPQVAK